MPSNRLRRTLSYALALTLVQVAMVIVASVLQMPAMRDDHEARVVQAAVEITQRLPDSGAPITDRDLAAALAGQGDIAYAEIPATRVTERLVSDVAMAARIPPLPDERFPDVRIGTLRLTASDDDPEQVVSQVVVPFRDVQGQPFILRAISESTAVGVAMEQLVDRLAIVAPTSFVAAGILAWLLLRRTLDPLRRVSEAIGSLGPGSLSAGAAELDPLEADEELIRMQRSLSQAIERIEEGYQAQSQFVANVAHELKTPIAVMLAEAQSLRGADATREELAELRDSVVEEMRRLGRMVESFLVVARAARGGALTRDDLVFLPEVVVDAVQHTQRLAAQSGVRVRPVLPPPESVEVLECRGDAELLDSMLQNLIRNAIRYSPQDEAVDVALAPCADGARITVRDRGKGVPPELAERLFERYVQAEDGGDDADDRGGAAHAPADAAHGPRARGFGLGLSIAANVARLHGGRISAENHPDGGALFVVVLPVGAAAREPDEGPPEHPGDGT